MNDPLRGSSGNHKWFLTIKSMESLLNLSVGLYKWDKTEWRHFQSLKSFSSYISACWMDNPMKGSLGKQRGSKPLNLWDHFWSGRTFLVNNTYAFKSLSFGLFGSNWSCMSKLRPFWEPLFLKVYHHKNFTYAWSEVASYSFAYSCSTLSAWVAGHAKSFHLFSPDLWRRGVLCWIFQDM